MNDMYGQGLGFGGGFTFDDDCANSSDNDEINEPARNISLADS